MELLRLEIPGIHCEGWLPAIRLAVRQARGTRWLSEDVPSRLISIEYDPSVVSVDTIQQALEGIGYESTVVPGAWPRYFPPP